MKTGLKLLSVLAVMFFTVIVLSGGNTPYIPLAYNPDTQTLTIASGVTLSATAIVIGSEPVVAGGVATETVIEFVATETANRIASDALKADLNGSATQDFTANNLNAIGTSTFFRRVGVGSTPTEAICILGTGTTMARVGDALTGGSMVFGQDAVIGPVAQSHTDSLGRSLQNTAAVRLNFGASGFIVSSSPATPVGTIRVWTVRFTLNPSGNLVGTGNASFTGRIDVATPTTGMNAATMNYVNSAVSDGGTRLRQSATNGVATNTITFSLPLASENDTIIIMNGITLDPADDYDFISSYVVQLTAVATPGTKFQAIK